MRLPNENPPPGTARGESSRELVEKLQQQIARIEKARSPHDTAPISSGCDALDQLLPERGFRHGTLVEWLAEGDGAGAETLVLITARSACRAGAALVVLDGTGEFYPPAAARMGLELDHMILVQAANSADHLWAMDQALRCPGVGAVLGWLEKIDGRTFRRLQLAAEQGSTLGLFIRPASVQQEPSWADVRLLVEPRPGATNVGRRLKIQVLRSRGQTSGGTIEVEIDDETCTVHLAARLDRPAIQPRATGA
ncbi:MAG: hypothetical protein HUU20_17070 [Pirellulales bacterium]|nr:hypothetical protein [Pirellulales bacterium]